jgi:hypothetical protein
MMTLKQLKGHLTVDELKRWQFLAEEYLYWDKQYARKIHFGEPKNMSLAQVKDQLYASETELIKFQDRMQVVYPLKPFTQDPDLVRLIRNRQVSKYDPTIPVDPTSLDHLFSGYSKRHDPVIVPKPKLTWWQKYIFGWKQQ